MAKRRVPKGFIAFWMILILCLSVYYLCLAPRDSVYSEEENRNLAGFPAITAESLFSGKFGEEVEAYLLDRFPFRSQVVSVTNYLENALSFASHEEYLMIAEGPEDILDSGDYQDDLEDLLNNFTTGTTPPTTGFTEPQETQPQGTEPEETQPPVTEPVEDPPIVPKPQVSLEDFSASLCLFMDRGDGEVAVKGYSRENVAAVTAVLNKYAALLPENGKLMFTVVPQSSNGNRFASASNKVSFFSTWDEMVEGLGRDNVYAFDAAEILGEAMKEDAYVYFRTDMHWTPYGSYLVYCEMVRRAGKEPCSYTEDFDITVEEPFRGTYYRDNPAAYMDIKADALELLMPKFPLEWRRITSGDEYKLLPFLDFDARSNDRYTVYLGGPAGPWTYAECDNGQEENCLVITDSYGLSFLPFLTCNYKQVHYYDTRYFSYDATGATVAEMMEKYDIQDVYVVVGDLHSFDSSFLLTNANKQLDSKS